ncbi:sialin-like isoform X1 [Oscarella lobularis]|uniref:sialin-like isoform X1 n=1 Tax=Oscarella lobularis TaxID=121494 RepID=UPI003313CD9F
MEAGDVKLRRRFSGFPARYALAMMFFLGFAVSFALRVNLSVAIVEMKKEFGWNSKTSGIILSAFYVGYVLTQVPFGLLAARYGSKRIFGGGVLCASLLSLLTPVAAYHKQTLILLRILQGLALGGTYPSTHAMWRKWAPPLERSKLVAISFAGGSMGIAFAMTLSGLLCESGFRSPPHQSKWPSVFYVFGGLGLVWCVAWFALVHDSPQSHPRISIEERDHIVSAIERESGLSLSVASQERPLPLLQIMTSPAVWAIILSTLCFDWGSVLLSTIVPTFVDDVLRFGIAENGILSSLPFLLTSLFTVLGGWIADAIRKRQLLSTGGTRNLMNSIGMFLPALFLVVLNNVSSRAYAVLICLCLATAVSPMSRSGYFVNVLDIAPQYAGFLMGITNSAGILLGVFAPYSAGAMASAPSGLHILQLQWKNIFYLAAEIYAFGGLTYLILSSGQIQWWAKEGLDQSPGNGRPANGNSVCDEKEALLSCESTV